MGFIASTDQSYPDLDRGWSRQTLSQTSSVWCCHSHACVAVWSLHRRDFYQRTLGNSSQLSHVASVRKKSECIQRNEQQYPGGPCNRLPASCVEVLWLFQNPKSEKSQPTISYSNDPCWATEPVPADFIQILCSMLYMSLNSRSWQIKCFPIVCGYEHLPVSAFLIHRPVLIFESSLVNKSSSSGGKGLFCQVN